MAKEFKEYLEDVQQMYASLPDFDGESSAFTESMIGGLIQYVTRGKVGFDPNAKQFWQSAAFQPMKKFLMEVKKFYSGKGYENFEDMLNAEIKKYQNKWNALTTKDKQKILTLVKSLDQSGFGNPAPATPTATE